VRKTRADQGEPSDYNVRVLPAGHEFRGERDETIYEAAARAGLRWPTICEGEGICGTCHFVVVENAENLSAMDSHESEALRGFRRYAGDRTDERLACQARLHGDVTVLRKGVRALGDP
jgi:2Fe-2S ferredoxin